MSERLIHFTHTDALTDVQLEKLIELALAIADQPQRYYHRLAGQLLINLFCEPSTRTRVSFETAALRLGIQVVNIAAQGSSVEKGESLEDTYDALQAMHPDFLVIRHAVEGTAQQLADRALKGTHVINAGDGTGAHPTQALLDAVTLKQHFGDLSKLKVVLAGDIKHSRVARSCLALLPRLGVAELRLAGPAEFLPRQQLANNAKANEIKIYESFDEALSGADVVMMLRIQKERIFGLAIPAAEDYHKAWGLTEERMQLAALGARVLHPGPMNRGVEIASAVADGPQSLVRRQVRNGLHTRMAVLLTLAGQAGV
ncbi:MAG: aspartate carbamoyltransferase catalytic subunit [Xanthomonadales bacterium]|nr:aspartate carbamoyltransferase catalytic subunit [Xanthomonadales bacterium]